MLITELVDLLDAPVIRVIKDCSSVDAQLMGSTMLVQANILVNHSAIRVCNMLCDTSWPKQCPAQFSRLC